MSIKAKGPAWVTYPIAILIAAILVSIYWWAVNAGVNKLDQITAAKPNQLASTSAPAAPVSPNPMGDAKNLTPVLPPPTVDVGLMLGTDGLDRADCNTPGVKCYGQLELLTKTTSLEIGARAKTRFVFRVRNIGSQKLIHPHVNIWSRTNGVYFDYGDGLSADHQVNLEFGTPIRIAEDELPYVLTRSYYDYPLFVELAPEVKQFDVHFDMFGDNMKAHLLLMRFARQETTPVASISLAEIQKASLALAKRFKELPKGEQSSPPAEGRIFVGKKITPEYFKKVKREHTDIQGDKLLAPYIDKWMRIKGTIDNVSEYDDSYSISMAAASGGYIIAMYFNKSWGPKITILVKGERVKVEGQITNIGSIYVALKNCKLV